VSLVLKFVKKKVLQFFLKNQNKKIQKNSKNRNPKTKIKIKFLLPFSITPRRVLPPSGSPSLKSLQKVELEKEKEAEQQHRDRGAARGAGGSESSMIRGSESRPVDRLARQGRDTPTVDQEG